MSFRCCAESRWETQVAATRPLTDLLEVDIEYSLQDSNDGQITFSQLANNTNNNLCHNGMWMCIEAWDVTRCEYEVSKYFWSIFIILWQQKDNK